MTKINVLTSNQLKWHASMNKVIFFRFCFCYGSNLLIIEWSRGASSSKWPLVIPSHSAAEKSPGPPVAYVLHHCVKEVPCQRRHQLTHTLH